MPRARGALRMLPRLAHAIVRFELMSPGPRLSVGAVAGRREVIVDRAWWQPGDLATVVGVDFAGLSAALAADPTAPHLLQPDLADAATVTAMIGRVLDHLADVAQARWPHWNEAARLASPRPLLSTWRRAAARLVLADRRPRFPQLARETEMAHLLSVLPGLVLLVEVDPLDPDRATPLVATLEWCCRHGAGAVAVLSEPPAPESPWDRLLSRVVTMERPPVEPASRRPVAVTCVAASGGSLVERRMREALLATPDLAGLFEDQVTLRLGSLGPTPRVDMVWHDGKVMVELDGPEHGRDPTYAADRHRDYELLVAGYLVLRLTNAEVELDLGRSLDKVRRVVDLRRAQR